MVGGITKHELKVLMAAIIWYKELANKPATDVLWNALSEMMKPKTPTAKRKVKSKRVTRK